MSDSSGFQKSIDIFCNNFITIFHSPIKVICKKSVDGILSASLFSNLLIKQNVNFSISFVKDFDDSIVKELNLDTSKNILFLGFSTEKISLLDKKKVFFISDSRIYISDNILNKELNIPLPISSYFLHKQITDSLDLSYIPLISGSDSLLLDDIEKDALNSKIVSKVDGFNLFGSNTRQFHKVLEYSLNPFILSISGSEENSINILSELDISIKDNGFGFMLDLDEDDILKLVSTLNLDIVNIKKNNILLLDFEDSNSPLRDINEFRDFLKACVHFDKPSLGVSLCLKSKSSRMKALELLKDFKLEVIKALNLYYTSFDDKNLIERDNVIIINYSDLIKVNVLDEVASLICKFTPKLYSKRIILLSQTALGSIKCSIPLSSIDQSTNDLISKLNVNTEKTKDVISFFTDVEESKLIEILLSDLESIKMENVSS